MKNVHEVVTNKLVEALESGMGLREWIRPWVSVKPMNFTSGHRYQGLINLMNLGYETIRKGYEIPFWASFLQVQKAGGLVRSGEKATWVLFSKTVDKKTATIQDDLEGDETPKRKSYRVYRLSPVFNIQQTDLKIEQYREKFGMATAIEPDAACDAAEAWIKSIPHEVMFVSDTPSYSPVLDRIKLPSKIDFDSPQAFISTYCHELTHWSGAKHRLNRLTEAKFGTPDYAKEELVAELGSAFLCAEFGIDAENLQHPSYLKSWLTALKQDAKFIFNVASLSKNACDFLKEKAQA